MSKIVVLDGYTLNPGDLSWAGIAAMGDITVYDRTPESEIIPRIGNADVVFTNKTPISERTLDACPSVRYIGVLATGYNIVDVKAAAKRGVTVTNIPTYSTDAVAQFAIAMLLDICHRVAMHSDRVHAGKWASCPDFCFWDAPLIELAGKTMGIVGFGRIGQATGRIAAALGMRVLAYDTYRTPEGERIAEYVDMATLLARSDVIALHCPLTPDTQNLINRERIARMKDGVIILNNSRGPLIDEAALAEALNTGKVYAAGVDVVSQEPIRPDNPLLTAKNCIITPHISWAPIECRRRLMGIAEANLRAFLEGAPVNTVS